MSKQGVICKECGANLGESCLTKSFLILRRHFRECHPDLLAEYRRLKKACREFGDLHGIPGNFLE